ncbi:hypothetical protein ACFU5Z_19575 [Streptomyces sp. NPDC057521]|uniref:hypothetical protein n=1 Tax=Streptomyces sp. NPDC057521 TaxID=3346156 RepID=UPI003696D4F9
MTECEIGDPNIGCERFHRPLVCGTQPSASVVKLDFGTPGVENCRLNSPPMIIY